eukprot:g12291.t1
MANPTQPGVEVISKEFKRDDNDTVLCADRVEVKFDGVTLDLAQSWENGEEMAPIFSGACWAGTVVWQAALDLGNYMSEHLRKDLVGATVVELGCGIGVPGMIARLLGATVVLTEQDELLSLLDRNLDRNFDFADHPRGRGGIRRAALDWERKADTDELLASLRPSSEGLGGGQGEGAIARRATRLEFILCADCVFEPLYGDSWKALAKVMGRLSDEGTTVLCSVERRGDDGVPQFLKACEAEGFSLQMVYRAAASAPAPVELYEFSKGGRKGLRGVPVAESDSGKEVQAEKPGGECAGGGGEGSGKAGLVGDSEGSAIVGRCSGGADEDEGGVLSGGSESAPR